jgi:hypothetical protein
MADHQNGCDVNGRWRKPRPAAQHAEKMFVHSSRRCKLLFFGVPLQTADSGEHR